MGGITPGPEGPDAGPRLPRQRVALICGLLLLASAINYMDRQTLANVGKRVTDEFTLSEQQYGALETSFGMSFAAGSMVFGILADRVSIRLLYPLVLLLWSLVGILTASAETYTHLLICRGLLGFFEAGHWPCALKTTQTMLTPRYRTTGNSVMQSGTSIGAILTPMIMLATLTPEVGSWRFGFRVIGVGGLIWIVLWFWIVRSTDRIGITAPSAAGGNPSHRWWHDLLTRRMVVILIVIALMNATWQTLRAWLPKIMQQEHQYSENFTAGFTSIWYLITDAGCLGAGLLAATLAARGRTITGSRIVTYAVCAVMCASLLFVPWLSRGTALEAVFLIAGAGSLGLFPVYYSFLQDVSREHQGKITGVAGIFAWVISSPMAMLFGKLADRYQTFSYGLAIAGALPLLALAMIVCFWPREDAGK